MNKLIVTAASLLFLSTTYANHCPPAHELIAKQGDKYIALTPPGWQWTESWGGKPKLKSDKMVLSWAMWDSERMDPYDANRVHCIYGDSDLESGHIIGLLQTVETVDRTQVEGKPNWQPFGYTYFRCEGPDVFQCLFG